MDKIQQHVYTWSNYTDVLFVADFPGMYLENYISNDFANVSLTVLEGEVTYSEEKLSDVITVPKKKSISIKTGIFHQIKTTSSYPATYMYTYTNQTKQQLDREKCISLLFYFINYIHILRLNVVHFVYKLKFL